MIDYWDGEGRSLLGWSSNTAVPCYEKNYPFSHGFILFWIGNSTFLESKQIVYINRLLAGTEAERY